MRVAILSDIHGNCVALDAVLSDMGWLSNKGRPNDMDRPDDMGHPSDMGREKVDQIVCLGDAIQGGPQPAEVVARLRELGCGLVMGNADAWLLTGEESGEEVISDERHRQLDAIRAWSLARLTAADLAFIEAFRPTVEITLEAGHKLLCFHGSPASFDDILMPDISQEELYKVLGEYQALAMTGGHTHVQFMRRIGANARFFFNPGSVGLAYSHHQPEESFRTDPWAEYALLTSEGERLAVEFRRVPFDVEALIAVYLASGRPYADTAIAQVRGRSLHNH